MIYFVRHGETDYNKEARLQGHRNIPLNKTGLNQAKQAQENSKDLQIDEIYSSPLSRAKKTAEIINKHHKVKITYDDRLKEIYMGKLQGACIKDLSEEEKQLSHSNPETFGGESIQEFCARVESFFKEIENTNKNILIVSHGGVYRAIYRYIKGFEDLNFDMEQLKNATIVLINK